MDATPFNDIIDSEAELRALVGEPSELVKRKQLAELDEHCQAFIARSPFVLVGTSGDDGLGDVSPRGDAPGFARVLDARTLAIPERPGNRRVDTLRNILETGSIGLLFLIPGYGEMLRVNGRAVLVRDADLLAGMAAQGKTPLLAIGVRVREAYLHCAKATRRSRLWEPASWLDRAALPSLAQMICDQAKPSDMSLADVERLIDESYTRRLY